MGDFKLTLEPAEKVIFASKKLGEETVNTTVKITNPLKERIAYKIKCTSNDIFRIRPPVGSLKGSESANVTLTFIQSKTIPENGKHYFAFYYIKAEDEKKAGRQAWTDHKGEAEGTKKLFADFKKETDEKEAEKKEEKKEVQKKEEEVKKDEKREEPKKEEPKKEEEKKEEEVKKEEKKEETKKEAKDEKK